MEVGESSVTGAGTRKRTESNGASSDSELSDGWNIVDHVQDLHSSDGESVEVIEPDNESLGGTDGEGEPEVVKAEECKEVATKPTCPVVKADSPRRERQVPPPSPHHQPPEREEMFDSSFCRFLFFATSAVLVSNLAYMAAENSFVWNMDVGIDSPSFLRDLPTTPKQKQQDKFPNIIPWANNEEATVETAEDSNNEVKLDKNAKKRSTNDFKYTLNFQPVLEDLRPRETLNIDNYEVGKFFKALSETTDSVDVQDKFTQALLILDALQIGLTDLEEVVTENSELHRVLENQKRKLSDVLREVEFGVSKTMERLAINVLNKVQKLERKLENQWCTLENHGHKEDLKGLFYDCQDYEDKEYKSYKKDFDGESKMHDKKDDKYWKHNKGDKRPDLEKKRYDSPVNEDNFGSYEVDEDITGKVYSKPSTDKNSDEYYDLVHNKRDKYSKSLDFDHAKNYFKDKSYNYDKDKKYDDYKLKKESYVDTKDNNYDHAKVEFKDKRNDQYKEKKNDDYKFKKESYADNTNRNHDYGYAKNDFKDKNKDQYRDKKYDDKLKKESYSSEDGYHKDYKFTDAERNNEYKEEKERKDNHKQMDKHNDYHMYNEFNSKRKDNHKQMDKHNDYHMYNEFNSKHRSDHEYNEHRKEKYHHGNEKPIVDKSTIETLVQILKEKCDSDSGSKHRGENPNDYHKFKSKIDEKLGIPKTLFDDLYEKYCKNGNKYKQNEKYVKHNFENNHHKQEEKSFPKGEPRVILDENRNVMSLNVEVIAPPKENDPQSSEARKEIVIPPVNQPWQWIISHENLSTDNKTDISGDWFIKNGEFRSKVRWSHHRGDWWFERALNRRAHPQTSTGWFPGPGRHKNWFFRRAWARQQCRQSPQGGWCALAEEDTVTIPPPPSASSSKER